MIIIDLFDIDIHIFTVIKFLFNLGVRFNYIIRAINYYYNTRIIIIIILLLFNLRVRFKYILYYSRSKPNCERFIFDKFNDDIRLPFKRLIFFNGESFLLCLGDADLANKVGVVFMNAW